MNKVKSTFLKSAVIAVFLFISNIGYGQLNDTDWSKKQWDAFWITLPEISNTDYGVYLFRKSFELSPVPKKFPVYVSADNRYKLYVNEKLVAMGPAKSDLSHWRFEIVDLAPYLISGKNSVSAKVWNEAEFRPEFQMSFMTGFLLQGGTEVSKIVNTDSTWKVMQDSSYRPIIISGFSQDPNVVKVPGWYIAGPGEKIDMNKRIDGWEKLSFDDKHWKNAHIISAATPKNIVGFDASKTWSLVPSPLPQMELKKQRLEKIRKVEGIAMPTSFPSEKSRIYIAKRTAVSILLDQTFLTNAFPTLVFSGGKNSIITLTYAESLYKDGVKGNRNEVEGKEIIGRKDIIISNGFENQNFTPLAYRTYRYIEIKIETKEEPVVIEDLYGTFIGYPFELKSKLEINVPEIDKMVEIGWRTARLCANETYMDCPYWEQLQYIGDTRIQALVTLFNSNDDRLVKNAINLIDYSRQPEGVTLSRYPTINAQIIPTFSLWYIGMLHDYMMYGSDQKFSTDKLASSRQVLHYFEEFIAVDGSLKNVPNWFFTDWVKAWKRGMAPVGKDGSSAVLDLQLLLAYQNAAAMEQAIGMKEFASVYKNRADRLAKTINDKYWDDSKKMFADTPEKDKFSQHANAMAILANLVTGDKAEKLGRLLLSDTTIAQASIYFKYYVHQALVKAGLGNDYLNWLDIWRKNMELGLTTWGEDSEVETTRSDCHAWGASPNIEFFRVVLGIESDAIGFSKIKIEPHLGTIKTIGGEMPHPNGKITVKYTATTDHLTAEINLPVNTTGQFIWKGKSYAIKSGKNTFKI